MSASHAEVIRDGKQAEILAVEIVPGDVIVVIK
jgi:magnesium-transporting ATPase (P-type)